MDDRALYEAWRAGDRAAGSRLVDRYLGSVGRFFATKVADESTAQELVADTFERCVRGLGNFRGDASFRSFLFGVARNVLREHVRRRKRDPAADLQKLLLAALRGVPIEYQIVLELTYFEDMSRSEIAAVLELPPGTVASRLRKARVLLDEQLAALANDADLLRSTTTNLEQWARSLRELVRGGDDA